MTALEVMRWLLAGLLGAAATYVAALNWYALVKGFTTPNAPSWMPLIGSVFGVAALLLEPTGRGRWYWWIPLIADAGTIPGFAVTAVWWLRRKRGQRR